MQPKQEIIGRLIALTEAKTGFVVPERKLDAIFSDLKEMADSEGLDSLLKRLCRTPLSHPMWQRLIGKLVVTESYFFRDKGQFDIIINHILPSLLEIHKDDLTLRIWSAGCATGEEPYSIAILLKEHIPDVFNTLILATDINIELLERAKRGIYRQWSLRSMDSQLVKRYFTKQNGLYKIKSEIADMVRFEYLNLAEDTYPSLQGGLLDLILCRNVIMYLKPDLIPKIMEKFYNCLRSGGWLILGAVEVGAAACEGLVKHNFPEATVYQKRPGTGLKGRLIETQKPSPTQRKSPEIKELSLEELILAATDKADKGQLDESLELVEKAISRDSSSPEARILRAMILQEKGDLENAVSELKKAIYIDPNSAPTHLRLAYLYQQLGKRRLYRRHMGEALRLLQGESNETVEG